MGYVIEYERFLYGADQGTLERFESVIYPWCHRLTLCYASGLLEVFANLSTRLAQDSSTPNRLRKVWLVVFSMPFLCDNPLHGRDRRAVKIFHSGDGGVLNDVQRKVISTSVSRSTNQSQFDAINAMAYVHECFQDREWAKEDASLDPRDVEELRAFGVEKRSFRRFPSDQRAICLLARDESLPFRHRQLQVREAVCNWISKELNRRFGDVTLRSRFLDRAYGKQWQTSNVPLL